VHETILQSGWDNILVGLPLIGLLIIGFFRLDEVFLARNRGGARVRRVFSGAAEDGKPMVRDPDGRPSW